MFKAWLLFAGFYSVLCVFTGWALCELLGTRNVLSAIAATLGLQLLRLVPGFPSRIVRELNYHLVLTFYRLNYLYTLGLAISALSAPLLGWVYLARAWNVQLWTVAAQVVAVILWTNHVRARSDRASAKDYPSTRRKRVAVIGGGCAGIVACKEMLDEGHDVVGFESASVLGGVWSSGDTTSKRTTGRTLSSSSRSNSFFGDFPFPHSVHGKSDHPTHYTEEDFREYLLAYVSAFKVDVLYRLKTTVTSAKRSSSSSTKERRSALTGWVLKSVGPDGLEVEETYDFLVVASGLNQKCSGLQLGPESGPASHTCSLRGNQGYDGKKVVVVGLGESSSDATSDIANVASQVHVIVRSPVLLLPRNTFGTKIAPDHKLSRLVLHCPQFIRTWKLMSQTALHGPLNVFATKLLGLRGRFGVDLSAMDKRGEHEEGDGGDSGFEDNWSYEWWSLFMKLGPLHPRGGWGVTRGQVTKTAPLVKNYRQGNVKFHTADISSVDTSREGLRTVRLADGTSIDGVHSIVNATGYKTVWPFLAPEGLAEHCTRDRYRLVFHPDLPEAAFIGFCRGGVGSIMQGIEMQSRWAALVCSGRRRLPPVEEMKELVARHKTQMVGKFPTKITNVYCNALARYEVGCEPNLWQVFWTSPTAWFYLMAGPFCMSMYRFSGPHARPKVATEAFESAPELVRPLEFLLQQVMELVLGVLCRFWTSLPIIHSLRLSRFMRQFVTPFVDLNY